MPSIHFIQRRIKSNDRINVKVSVVYTSKRGNQGEVACSCDAYSMGPRDLVFNSRLSLREPILAMVLQKNDADVFQDWQRLMDHGNMSTLDEK